MTFKELEELEEAQLERDNGFEQTFDISFKWLSGGISLLAKDETVSISTSLEETGTGSFKLSNEEPISESLYNSLKEDFLNICKNFDDEVQQILTKNGLKSTR